MLKLIILTVIDSRKHNFVPKVEEKVILLPDINTGSSVTCQPLNVNDPSEILRNRVTKRAHRRAKRGVLSKSGGMYYERYKKN